MQRLPSLKSSMSIVLNPAVRVVTDWKSACQPLIGSCVKKTSAGTGQDEPHDRQVDERVAGIGHQRTAAARPHEVKAGIAEGRDGVKDGHPAALQPAVVAHEDGQQQAGAQELCASRELQDEAQHAHDAADLLG